MCRTTGCSWLQPRPHSRCKHRHPQKSDRAVQELHGVWVMCARETDLSFLPCQSWNPPRAKEGKKKKHLGAELEGNLPLLLQFSPGACLALLRRPLCLPSQIREYLGFSRASQEVLVVKNLPANAGDLRGTGSMSPRSGRSPGGGHGNPLQSSCWRIPWTEEPGGLQSMGLPRVRHY